MITMGRPIAHHFRYALNERGLLRHFSTAVIVAAPRPVQSTNHHVVAALRK